MSTGHLRGEHQRCEVRTLNKSMQCIYAAWFVQSGGTKWSRDCRLCRPPKCRVNEASVSVLLMPFYLLSQLLKHKRKNGMCLLIYQRIFRYKNRLNFSVLWWKFSTLLKTTENCFINEDIFLNFFSLILVRVSPRRKLFSTEWKGEKWLIVVVVTPFKEHFNG